MGPAVPTPIGEPEEGGLDEGGPSVVVVDEPVVELPLDETEEPDCVGDTDPIEDPGVIVGDMVIPSGKKYTSSMNAAPIRSGSDGGKASRSSGLYLNENVTVCGPGGMKIVRVSKSTILPA